MNDRRPARQQKLPEYEVEHLRSLRDTPLYIRCHDLYSAGWTLRAIGEAFNPPRPRSTIKSWLDKVTPRTSYNTVPSPIYVTDPTYTPTRPASPGINAADLTKIQELQPVAKRFRAGMSPRHKAALANDELTFLVKTLHEGGVPVQELATAAGVTYRAMAKRLNRTK